MKKIMLVVVLLISVVSLSGCLKEKEGDIEVAGENFYVYPIEEEQIVEKFFVDENKILYYTVSKTREEEVEIEGGTTSEFIEETVLYSLDEKGRIIDTNTIPTPYISYFCISDDILYYYTDSKFYSYHISEHTTEELFILQEAEDIKKISIIDNVLYILAVDSVQKNKSYSLANPDDGYYYMGECIVTFDLSSKKLEYLDIELPISFAENNNGILIYAYDGEKGYYFIEYHKKEEQFINKKYRNLNNMSKFVCLKDKDTILFNNINSRNPSLAIASITKNDLTELIPNVGIGMMYLEGDYIYYLDGMKQNQIVRAKYKEYVRGSKTIRTISSISYAYAPFGTGYMIDTEYPEKDSFALSVLSQDTDYDLYIVSSRDDISDNIKNKGSFYPLNEIEGVKEYMDSLFPYIKDAATTEEGDIWMIPILVEIPYIIYNEENCRINGLDFSKEIKYSDFLTAVDRIKEKEKIKDSFSYSDYLIGENALYQYMREYSSFEGEVFLELANLIKEKANYTSDTARIMNFQVQSSLYQSDKTKDLFAFQYGDIQLWMDGMYSESLRASKMPVVKENSKSVATSIFLCVNPASKNLKETLSYISALCKDRLQGNESKIFQKNQTFESPFFQEVYQIYENGEITFTMPRELYSSEFASYLAGEIDLNAMMKEANRKIEIYKRE